MPDTPRERPTRRPGEPADPAEPRQPEPRQPEPRQPEPRRPDGGPREPDSRQPEPREPREPRQPEPKAEDEERARTMRELARGPKTAVGRLVEFATAPGTPQADSFRALRAAENRLTAEALRLHQRAQLATGAQATTLAEEATATLKRAVAVGDAARKLAPPLKPEPRIPPPQPAPPAHAQAAGLVVVSPPRDVRAVAGTTSAFVSWSEPQFGAPDRYLVLPVVNGTARPEVSVPAPLTSFELKPLASDSRVTFTVRAAQGDIVSAPSAPTTPVVVGQAVTEFTPVLPDLSAEPTALLDPAAETKRRLLAQAGELAGKWRYEYLKAQAARAAQDTVAFEQQVAAFMAMNLEKIGTAELLLSPVLTEAATTLQEQAQGIRRLAGSPDINALLKTVAGATAEALMLQRLLLFLAETSPVEFWVGLFGNLIDDVAHFDGGIPRTKDHLRKVFGNPADEVGVAAKKLIDDIKATLDAEVDRLVGPLRDAVASIVGSTSESMAGVFSAFDEPLVMAPASGVGLPDIPNANPLSALQDQLARAVDDLAADLKREILAVLNANGGQDLFVAIAATYLALPILAFLVIAVAGGPFSAAALAAVVLLAAQELARLIVRWLSGPLLDQLNDVKEKLAARARELHGLFAREADLLRISNPGPLLDIVASELRELKNALPSAFLDDAAAVLDEARSVMLRTATQLALAAEQALGMETGTAYDAVSFLYETALTPAEQMPGGTEPTRLAGAALLRDLGKLEQQRTGLHDGKELELTQPVSLDAIIPALRANGQAVVQLGESDLLDSRTPGLYRALIRDVRLRGVLTAGASATFVTGGIPVTVTHLGESRTRVKRSANPAAPPLGLPDCEGLRLSSHDFANRVLLDVPGVVRAFLNRALDLREAPFGATWGIPFSDVNEVLDFINVPAFVARTVSAILPETLCQRMTALGCGLVDVESTRAAINRIVARLDFSAVPSCRLGSIIGFKQLTNCPDDTTIINQVLAAMPLAEFTTGAVHAAVKQAHARTVADLRARVGKWGDATLVEDPDPDVRALGYATLVRRGPEEAAVFNLVGTAGGVAAALTGDQPRPVEAVGAAAQYRPFENRGLEGRLLVAVPAEAAAALTSLVLDVTIGACHDPALAATVRSSRSRQDAADGIVRAFAGTVRVVEQSRMRGAGDLRTVHLSLRAHRDNTLRTWLAAQQAASLPGGVAPGATGLPDLTGVTPLAPGTAYTPLPGADLARLQFRFRQQPAGQADLLALANTAFVSPRDLGMPATPIDPLLPVADDATLVSIGLAVVPTAAGATTFDTSGNRVENLPLALSVPAPLDTLLKPVASGGMFPRLAITSPATPGVPLASAFPANGLDLVLATNGALGSPAKVYDVILSLTYRVPVLEVAV